MNYARWLPVVAQEDRIRSSAKSVLLHTEGARLEGHIVGDQNQITALGVLWGLHGHLPRQHANVIAALRALRPEIASHQQELGHPLMICGKQNFILISVLRICI